MTNELNEDAYTVLTESASAKLPRWESRTRKRWLLTLALTLACALVGTPKVTAQQSSKADGESLYAKLDGARVHYQSYGKGDEALVLVHGWGSNIDFWRDSTAELAKHNRVVVLDLPGHGKSDKPEVKYTMDFFARAIDAVMNDAKVKRAVLVGHSMGTPVARQFYRKYPTKTLGIVIVDGSLRPFGDKKLMETFIAAFRGPNYKEAGQQMFNGMAGPNLSPVLRDQIQASFLNTPQHVLVSAMEGMADDSIFGPDTINVPVLAILAEGPFWPADTEQFARTIAPNLNFQMWGGVGHFLHMEKPKQFNDAVKIFLDMHGLL